MTRQESFKQRVRQRMAKTGERYTAARKVLLDQAAASSTGRPSDRVWVSPPEMSNEAMVAATGRGHDEWADIIDAFSGDRPHDHQAVAAHLEAEFDVVDGWWAQGITVSYERITGLRLPYQRADGTFACAKSQTVAVDADVLRKMLLSDEHRADLFPDRPTELRSKPTTKALRIGIGPDKAVALFGLDDLSDGRTRVSIQHEKLPTYESVEVWKFYWSDWLNAIDESSSE